MNKLTELQEARLKVIRANNKIATLKKRNISTRSDEFKYWREQLRCWQDYEKELYNLHVCPCSPEDISLGKVIMGSGEYHIKVICPRCGSNLKGNGQWLKKSNIPPEILNELPTFYNYAIDTPPCKVCGAIGAELHHWAPKEIFGEEESEQWPQDYLCTKHHQEWHNRITIPLRKFRRLEERNGHHA